MEGDVKLILVTFSCLATGNNAVIYPATNTPDDLAAITEILAATEKYKYVYRCFRNKIYHYIFLISIKYRLIL